MTEKNQIENQIDLLFEKSLISENQENLVCNIYKEQFDLINELPIEDRCKVLYIAISKAFYDCERKNQKNQIENQIENTYIYNSISISNSISIYSKKLLSLLFKTIICKNYSKNRGGKREGAGRKKKPSESQIILDDNQRLYGDDYHNVCLTDKQYQKLLGICLSEYLLKELINALSINIEVGKENPYCADYPNAHYERIRSYYNYRKTHPEQFRNLPANVIDRSEIFAALKAQYGDSE